jgi:hypothetical protein
VVPKGASDWNIVELALGRTNLLAIQFVGTFEGVAMGPPFAVTMLWIVSASVILVLGVVASSSRHAVGIVVLIVASLVLPTVLMVSQARSHGLVWQARDGFPLYAGILLVAGAVAGRRGALVAAEKRLPIPFRGLVLRLSLFVVSVIAFVQLGDFVWALRRYTVGLGSVLNPFARVRGGWSPPLPSVVLFVVIALDTAFYCWWMARLSNETAASSARYEVAD